MGGNGNDEEPEGFDESAEVEDDEIVEILDGDRTRRCVVLAIGEVDGKEYALLAPAEQLDEPETDQEEDLELFIFTYGVTDEGVETYEGIDDEELFERVKAFFSTLISTEDEEGGSDPDLN